MWKANTCLNFQFLVLFGFSFKKEVFLFLENWKNNCLFPINVFTLAVSGQHSVSRTMASDLAFTSKLTIFVLVFSLSNSVYLIWIFYCKHFLCSCLLFVDFSYFIYSICSKFDPQNRINFSCWIHKLQYICIVMYTHNPTNQPVQDARHAQLP